MGKWSVSFNNNTNVTITAPDNTTTNFTIPATDAAYFQNPLFVYVGTLPNNNANIGQSSTFSQVTRSLGLPVPSTITSRNVETSPLCGTRQCTQEDAPGVF